MGFSHLAGRIILPALRHAPRWFAIGALTAGGWQGVEAAPISAEARDEVLAGLVAGMRDHYVLPEKGARLASELEGLGGDSAFQAVDDTEALTAYLNLWLRDNGDDHHLRVNGPDGHRMSPGGGPRRVVRREDGDEPAGPDPRSAVRSESGDGPAGPGPRRFVVGPGGPGSPFSARKLEGNVGYLKVDGLMGDPAHLDAALNELAGVDAVIFDLRDCPGGGYPLNLNLSATLFAEPAILMYRGNREGDLDPLPVQPRPEAPSFAGRPAYVLVNARTGSACEEVAWDLKYHDKALVVGERTAGAGLGLTEMTELGHGFTAFIPDMRPVHPNTPLGFEGTGVAPDVSIDSALALETAHLMALKALQAEKRGVERERLAGLHAAVADGLTTKLLGAAQASRELRDYEGRYADGRVVEVRFGRLLTSKGGIRDLELHRDEGDTFTIAGTPGQNVRFIREDGQVTALVISEPHARSWREPIGREAL